MTQMSDSEARPLSSAYDTSWLETAQADQDGDFVHPRVPHPQRMQFDEHCQRVLREIAQQPSVPCPKGWDDYYSDGWHERLGSPADLERFLRLDWIVEEIYDQVSVWDNIEPADEGDGTDEESETDTLMDFILNPSAEGAKAFPGIADDPVAFIRQVKQFELQKAARQILALGETLNLRTPLVEVDGLPGPLELWLQLVPTACIDDDDENPLVFSLRASVALHQPDAAPRLIAYLSGPYVPVCDMHPSTFFEACDAHSQELNDVWRSINAAFMARNKAAINALGLEVIAACFDSRAKQIADLDRLDLLELRFGLCAPWIEVHPDFRGRGVAEWMMLNIFHASDNPESTCYMDGTPFEESDDDSAKRTTSRGMVEMLRYSPIRLFCIAVPGSPNEARGRRNILARAGDAKLPSPAVLDLSIERRRRGLLRHFEAINAKNLGVYIHAYDPNSMVST
jgi:hypothetical protein